MISSCFRPLSPLCSIINLPILTILYPWDDNTAGLCIQVGVMSSQPIGEVAREHGDIAMCRDIPINARLAQQQVAQ